MNTLMRLQKRSRIAHYFLAIGLATTSLLSANIASADTKIFPATICKIWGGDDHLAEYIQYSQFGKVINTHPTQRVGIVCPIMREHTNRRADVRVYWADGVFGAGANNTGTLSCRLRSNTVWGGQSVASQGYNSENHSGTQYAGVESGSWVWQNLYADGSTNYTLFCLLPPTLGGQHSFIGSIRTSED